MANITQAVSVTLTENQPRWQPGETLGGNLAGFTYNAANGHWYAINDHAVSWTQARAEALAAGGYLATVTSSAENVFVASLLSSYVGALGLQNAYAYVGGSDAGVDGTWLWMDDPKPISSSGRAERPGRLRTGAMRTGSTAPAIIWFWLSRMAAPPKTTCTSAAPDNGRIIQATRHPVFSR